MREVGHHDMHRVIGFALAIILLVISLVLIGQRFVEGDPNRIVPDVDAGAL